MKGDNYHSYFTQVSEFIKMKKFLKISGIQESSFSIYLRTGTGISSDKLHILYTFVTNYAAEISGK